MTRAIPGRPILIVGGGIGGLAAALALARGGFDVKVVEQASGMTETGGGIQFGPNAFAALDALGVGERARSEAVYADRLMMMDLIDGGTIVDIPVGDAFRRRFSNPYAVMHRADIHHVLLEGVRATDRIELVNSTRIVQIEQDDGGPRVIDSEEHVHTGAAVIGCDGVRSIARHQFVGDAPRVSGHAVYRTVVEADDFPSELRFGGPVLWVGPDCHLVHYPVRHGRQYNLVFTFKSDKQESWGVGEGTEAELRSHFIGIDERAGQLLRLQKSWRRWATADRDPIEHWSSRFVTLLGDAAHPMLQYLAQGACMALEDAVALAAALRKYRHDIPGALQFYERSRKVRTARVVLLSREFGRLCHVQGVERLVRNDLWKGRSQERFYDALEWLYSWRPEVCLAG